MISAKISDIIFQYIKKLLLSEKHVAAWFVWEQEKVWWRNPRRNYLGLQPYSMDRKGAGRADLHYIRNQAIWMCTLWLDLGVLNYQTAGSKEGVETEGFLAHINGTLQWKEQGQRVNQRDPTCNNLWSGGFKTFRAGVQTWSCWPWTQLEIWGE